MKTTPFAVMVLPFVLSACAAVGPDYTPPAINASARFVEGGKASAGDVTQTQWWRDLGDARLNTLVDRGLSQNLSIQTALERIEETRAVLGGSGFATAASGGVTGASNHTGATGVGTGTTNSVALNAGLVLDIFGGQRRAVQQARAQYDAANYDVGTARLAFLASLAGAYVDARYFQEALALTRQTIATRDRTLGLVRDQATAGTATELDRIQSQALLQEARAALPDLENGFNTAVYGIATLLAEPAAPLFAELQKGAAQPRPRSGSKAGVPADLLRNRPDVRSAERSFAAAVASVGVAEAALYPSVSLSGTITASSSKTWSFGPSITLPIANQSVLRASRDAAISQARQAELNWRAQVLSAVQETQSAQSSYLRNRRALAAQQAASASYSRAVELSQSTYSAGTTTLLTLLDAERSRASSRLSVAASVQKLANSWITLQVAAGRGWAVTR